MKLLLAIFMAFGAVALIFATGLVFVATGISKPQNQRIG